MQPGKLAMQFYFINLSLLHTTFDRRLIQFSHQNFTHIFDRFSSIVDLFVENNT